MPVALQKDTQVLEYLKSLTLLCVEDNKTTQLLYEAIFEDLVDNILFADDGEEGYEIFINENVDIIITDYDMPVMDGLKMTEQIRELNKDIPIILVSAIEDITVITEALRLNVSNFIKKPIINNEVIKIVTKTSKILIANHYLEQQRKKKLKELEAKDEYYSYQEDLAFSKELNILRNDFYYQMITGKYTALVDFLYQPLDIVSGDAYSARKISQDYNFFLIVDGMGKGLSASLSAMLITSFINYIVDGMIEKSNFSLATIVEKAIEYIRPILLDDEALAIDFIGMDSNTNIMYYAKFAMPAVLMQNVDRNIIKLKSNNPPLSKYHSSFKVDSINIDNIIKFLFYSDGVVENITVCGKRTYAEFIEDDFKSSFTREDLKNTLFEKITTQEDDITLIFINKLNLANTLIEEREFHSSLECVDVANEWYDGLWQDITDSMKAAYDANVVFTELFMNAYEHGNLEIDAIGKHQMIEDDTYLDTLIQKGKSCTRKIVVRVDKVICYKDTYIITNISDEGKGFDTQILSEIFRNSQRFNGRGVFVSKKSSLGIYYNSKGNSVLYLSKI